MDTALFAVSAAVAYLVLRARKGATGTLAGAIQRDDRDWEYKAEGGANVAFSYCGGDARLRGCLLRVRKVASAHAGVAEALGVDASAQLLPHDPLHFSTGPIRQLIGEQYIVPGTVVALSQSFLEQLNTRLLANPLRPEHRRATQLEVHGGGYAVLMVDHSLLYDDGDAHSHPAAVPARTHFCVELKPKCGLLQARSGSSAAGGATTTAAGLPPCCRFCAHQLAKALDACDIPLSAVPAACDGSGGAAAAAAAALAASPEAAAAGPQAPVDAATAVSRHVSHYCPLNLFATHDASAMVAALLGATLTPQNNFRLFANGAPVFTAATAGWAAGDAAAAVLPATWASLEAALAACPEFASATGDSSDGDGGDAPDSLLTTPAVAAIVRAAGGRRPPPRVLSLCRLLAGMLQSDGVLDALAAAQSLDKHGAAYIWRTYKQIADGVAAGIDGDGTCGSSSSTPATGCDAPASKAEMKRYAACAGSVEAALAQAAAAASAGPAGAASDAATVRDFMLATTAKDCSVLLTFRQRPLPATHRAPAAANASSSSSSSVVASWNSAVAVVDVDPKPLSRVPHYALLDRELEGVYAAAGHLLDAAEKVCGARWRAGGGAAAVAAAR